MDDRRYQRIDHPGGSDVYNVVIPGWLFTTTELTARSDGKDEITIHVPKLKGIDWEVVESNGALTLQPTHSSMQPNPKEASTLSLIVRFPPDNMSDLRTFSLSRNQPKKVGKSR